MNLKIYTPCPCGSGLSFDACHAKVVLAEVRPLDLEYLQRRAEAEIEQQRLAQGDGKPFDTWVEDKYRFVRAGDRIWRGNWQTVTDFLKTYITHTFGLDWGLLELAKPPTARHRLLLMLDQLTESEIPYRRNDARVARIPTTGAAAVYLGLAYNLYCLEHNAEVHTLVLHRLRQKQLFMDTMYEISIAGAFVRAGFTLEMEDEADGESTHHEFTATHNQTGRKFSVECKRRNAAAHDLRRIGRLVRRALTKKAEHERIVFVDLNYPSHEAPNAEPEWWTSATEQINRLEHRDRDDLPPAWIVFTNDSNLHFPTESSSRMVALRHGFKRNELRPSQLTGLREALREREKNPEIHSLLESLRIHSSIPSTFDGSNPHLVFGDVSLRLLVGEQYDLGTLGLCTLVHVLKVFTETKSAACVMELQDGTHKIVMRRLTDDEFEGWRQCPTTFFGVVTEIRGPIFTPLDWYDVVLGKLQNLTITELLSRMSHRLDFSELSSKSKDELSSLLAQEQTENEMLRSGSLALANFQIATPISSRKMTSGFPSHLAPDNEDHV